MSHLGLPPAFGFLKKLPVFWKLQFLGWGAVAAYAFLTRASFWQSYTIAIVFTAVLEPAAILISAGLRQLYRKLGLRRGQFGKVIGVILLASGVAALIQLSLAELVNWAVLQFGVHGDGGPPMGVRMVFFWTIFSAWSFGYLWLKAEVSARTEMERSKAAATAAQRAELEMLRLQLNPHFLFNSLTNIAAEIPDSPDSAVEMTMQLADYLRYSLEHQDELIVPLSHEIDAMKNYLAIEKGRFTDRLRVDIAECGGANNIMVPCFLLQPLVENAVKHGLTTSAPPWDLSVCVRREEGELRICVSNTGILSKNWENGRRTGTGLVNLRRRLELHYPERHSFRLSQDGDQVVAEVELTGDALLV